MGFDGRKKTFLKGLYIYSIVVKEWRNTAGKEGITTAT